jgi:hypothetical protein
MRNVNDPTNISHVNLIQRDISGGRIGIDLIDKLREYPTANSLAISGLRQDTFEHLINYYGNQFKVIHFWKCPLVENLNLLSKLAHIEYIVWYWNQRVNCFWDMSKNIALKGLCIQDFSRLHDLRGIEFAPALESLIIGNAVWTKWIIDSLDPLSYCNSLKWLRIDLKKVLDGRIEPLTRIKNLHYIDFPKNQFTTEQVAWLKAKFSPKVSSTALAPYFRMEKGLKLQEKDLNTIITGKGKPFLNYDIDKKRIEKYTKEFNLMFNKYLEVPDLPEPTTIKR